MQTLVPIGSFEVRARKLLGEAGFERLLEHLAKQPGCGELIRGSGGLRKARIARPGRGKSGGARVIYYYRDDQTPILLLLIYAKAEQGNLTAGQTARLRGLVEEIVEQFG